MEHDHVNHRRDACLQTLLRSAPSCRDVALSMFPCSFRSKDGRDIRSQDGKVESRRPIGKWRASHYGCLPRVPAAELTSIWICGSESHVAKAMYLVFSVDSSMLNAHGYQSEPVAVTGLRSDVEKAHRYDTP